MKLMNTTQIIAALGVLDVDQEAAATLVEKVSHDDVLRLVVEPYERSEVFVRGLRVGAFLESQHVVNSPPWYWGNVVKERDDLASSLATVRKERNQVVMDRDNALATLKRALEINNDLNFLILKMSMQKFEAQAPKSAVPETPAPLVHMTVNDGSGKPLCRSLKGIKDGIQHLTISPMAATCVICLRLWVITLEGDLSFIKQNLEHGIVTTVNRSCPFA